MSSNRYTTEHMHRDIGMAEGRDYESALFGVVDTRNPAYVRSLNAKIGARIGNPDDQRHYLSFANSVNLAKEFQPWPDATNPAKDFLRELRLAIMDELNLENDAGDALKVFTAVGSPLDVFHGVDAFIEFTDSKNSTIQVTLDATTNQRKIESYGGKANVLVFGIPDISEGQEAYLASIEKLAKQIVEEIKLQQKEKIKRPPARSAAERMV